MHRLSLVLAALAVWGTSVGAALGASDPTRRMAIEVIGLGAALVGIVHARRAAALERDG